MDSSTATEDYQASLVDLTFNSKPHINALTMLAEEYMEYAEDIVKLIEARIHKVPEEGRLPVMYLMDSIVKNVGGNYKPYFARDLVKTFMKVFVTGADKTKMSLYKLRTTWDDYFPLKRLYELDNEVKKFDPNWPVKDLPAHLHDKQTKSIHVNPKFLKKTEVSTPTITTKPVSTTENDLAQDLINKQKQLLELQSQKLMLELQQTKQQLAMRERRKQVQQVEKKDPRNKSNREVVQPVKQIDNASLKNTKVTVVNKIKKGSETTLSQRFAKTNETNTTPIAKKSVEVKPKKSPKRKTVLSDTTSKNDVTLTKPKAKKSSPKNATSHPKKETKEKNFTSVSPKVVREMTRIPKKRPSNQDSSTPPKKSLKPNSANASKKRSVSPAVVEEERKREREAIRSSSNSPRFSSESDNDGNKSSVRQWKPPASKRPRPQNRTRVSREEAQSMEQHRRFSIDDDVQIPMELSVSHQREILQRADSQLKSGQVTHEQHQEILRQLHQLFEIQHVRSHPDEEQENYVDPRKPKPRQSHYAGRPRPNQSAMQQRRPEGNKRPFANSKAATSTRDPRRNRIENLKPPSQTFSPTKSSDSEAPVLEEPEDYIIASMSEDAEAYQKHSIGLRKMSTDADRAYLEHKKKILVATYNKQLSNSKTDSSGVESEEKAKGDTSDDMLSAKENKEVVVSPSLPLKKRKYKSANIEKPKAPVEEASFDTAPSQSTDAEKVDEKQEKDVATEVMRSMTPPPMPDMDALKDSLSSMDETQEKERSSSLPADDVSTEENFKSINPNTRRKKKFRGRRNDGLDHGLHEGTPPDFRNRSEERAHSEEFEDDFMLRPGPIIVDDQAMGWNQRGPRPRMDGPRRGMWPRGQRGGPFRGDRRMMEQQRRMRLRGIGPRGSRPPQEWLDDRHWMERDGPRMRRSPEMRRGPSMPPMRHSMNRSPPRRRIERFPPNMEWHDEFGGPGMVPPHREWDEPGPERFLHQGGRSFPPHPDHPRDRMHGPRMEPELFPQERDRRPPHQHRQRSNSPMENMPPGRDQLPHTIPAFEQPNTPPHQPAPEVINQVNVNKLLQDLQLKGILPTIKPIEHEPLPVTDEPLKVEDTSVAATPVVAKQVEQKPSIEEELLNLQEDANLPEVNINDLENLKIRHTKIINRLYTGIQCSACGMRFTARQTDVYAEHLDWHYRLNRKDREGQAQSFREFYPNAGGWIMYEEIDDPMKRAASQVFDENLVDEDSKDGATNEDNKILSVPVLGKEGEETCKVCKEPFETIYNEEEEEWQFVNCIRVDEETFHPDCYGDHDDDAELNPLPTPVRVPLFNPLNNAENHLLKVEDDKLVEPIESEVQPTEIIQEPMDDSDPPTDIDFKQEQLSDTKEEQSDSQLQIKENTTETSQDEQTVETQVEPENEDSSSAAIEVKKENIDTEEESMDIAEAETVMENVASTEDLPILNVDNNKNTDDNIKATEEAPLLDSPQSKDVTIKSELPTIEVNSVEPEKNNETNNDNIKELNPDTNT